MNQSATYVRSFWLAFVVYMLLVFLSIEFLKRSPESTWRYLVAILPMVPVFFGLRPFLGYLGSMDELQQRIHLQALGFAAGATGMITLTYGFLENAGLPRLSMLWVFPILSFFWGGAIWVLMRRYQ
jgi:hypothetical protein